MIRHSSPHLLAADFDYISGVIERNYVGPGILSQALAQRLAAEFAAPYVTLTESGTAGLLLGLQGLKERSAQKRRVVMGAYCCPEVVCAVLQAGLEPVFADCRQESLNIDMQAAAALIDGQTLAIICTNIGGVPDDYRTAASFGVPVISDCAQGVGARVDGRDLASLGNCAILSFGSTKMLTAGGGGAILCRNEPLGATVAMSARQELSVEEYRKFGFRVTFGQHFGDLTAGLVSAQVGRLRSLVERRREIAAVYDGVLRNCKDVDLVLEGPAVEFNRFRYYFLSDRAPAWFKHFISRQIDARRSISHAIPEYSGKLKEHPRLERLTRRVVSITISPSMTNADVAAVVHALSNGPGSAG